MKKLYPFLLVLATPVLLFLMSNSTGSPGGRTGSVGDNGNTCTGCHVGTANTVSGWITTNVPPEGYTPGQTYTITATGTHQGVVKFGFELTVENSQGAKVGTLQLTEPTRTKFTNNNKAVTHTAAGNVPTGSTNTWTMNWVAPSGVTGNIGIYAAFNAANGNGNNTGDVIYKSSTFISLYTPPAVLVSIMPNQAEQGDTFLATITGSNTNFSGNPSVSMSYSQNGFETINASAVSVVSPTILQATFSIPGSSSPGLWDVHVNNLNLNDGFTVLAAPVPALTGIVPDNGDQGSLVSVTITAENTSFSGTNPFVSIAFSGDPFEIINATNILVMDNTTIQADFDIPAQASVGLWNLSVDNLVLSNAFTVNFFTGINDPGKESLKIYPNPATDRFVIENATGADILVYNLNGELVQSIYEIKTTQEVNISSLSRGLYMVKITKEGYTRIEKLLVN